MAQISRAACHADDDMWRVGVRHVTPSAPPAEKLKEVRDFGIFYRDFEMLSRYFDIWSILDVMVRSVLQDSIPKFVFGAREVIYVLFRH